MMNNLVEYLSLGVDKYAKKGKLISKVISAQCDEISIKIKFERAGRPSEVGIFIYAENRDVSSVFQRALSTKSDYAIVTRSPMRQGGRYPFSLSQFSSDEKEYLTITMNTLIPEFVGRYHSLKSIEKALIEDIESGVFKKFELPELYMKLSMIRFAAREDWREYLAQAALLGSDVFRKTLEKLEKAFTAMNDPDFPEPPAPAK